LQKLESAVQDIPWAGRKLAQTAGLLRCKFTKRLPVPVDYEKERPAEGGGPLPAKTYGSQDRGACGVVRLARLGCGGVTLRTLSRLDGSPYPSGACTSLLKLSKNFSLEGSRDHERAVRLERASRSLLIFLREFFSVTLKTPYPSKNSA